MFVSIGGEVQLKWKTGASEMKCKKPVNINLLKIPFDGYPTGNWLLLRFLSFASGKITGHRVTLRG